MSVSTFDRKLLLTCYRNMNVRDAILHMDQGS